MFEQFAEIVWNGVLFLDVGFSCFWICHHRFLPPRISIYECGEVMYGSATSKTTGEVLYDPSTSFPIKKKCSPPVRSPILFPLPCSALRYALSDFFMCSSASQVLPRKVFDGHQKITSCFHHKPDQLHHAAFCSGLLFPALLACVLGIDLFAWAVCWMVTAFACCFDFSVCSVLHRCFLLGSD